MTIEWQLIKSFNNSQNNAFEELVCQLAREESITDKTEFYRVVAPDGGIEAYCVLKNGDEYGWQAKYFSSMGSSQWSQLKKSFETALRTHPKLTKYYICIPLDRQDPRIKKKNGESTSSFMVKWNEHTKKWLKYAQAQGRNISFEYWGSSELIHRLSEEKHAGRKLFWFSKEEFSDNWFKSYTENNIKNLGHRYTPKINFELDIAKNFDALSRNNAFRNILKEEFHSLFKAINDAKVNLLKKEDINNTINNLKQQFEISQQAELKYFDIQLIEKSCNVIQQLLLEHKESLEKNKDNSKKDSARYEIHNIRQLLTALYNFQEFSNNKFFELANHPVLILSGEAGIGKSHLLADIVSKHISQNKAIIFLLGQHFASEESPWTQILNNLLRIKCNEHELLGALNAKAEAQGERLLFMIDATNEGKGRYFWSDHIKGFIKDFSKYPWLSLVLSIRTSYEELLTSIDLIPDSAATRVVHHGFENVEYQASSFFFSQYGIQQPSIPLLHPEFGNPLFLKLFCEGLHRSGQKRIPKGYGGITSIIKFFLDNIDKQLSKPTLFDYQTKLVIKVINELIKYKLENDLVFIPYESAIDIVNNIISRYSNRKDFVEHLISEGVLFKNIYWINGDNEEGISFAYERFEDHLIVSYLLEKHLNKDNLKISFENNSQLAKYITHSYQYQGIIEALSIQLPEKIDKELYELIPENKKPSIEISEVFIKSLIWRKPETIKEKVKEYVNEHILPYEDTFNLFMQMVYSVASDPEHFFNADSLHRYLMKFSLADRDAFWTIYLHDKDYQGSAMQRLIDWALQEEDKSYLSDESRLLAAKALTWLFTSTNISFRDSATKALVCLLENQLPVILRLIDDTHNINDPYVQERVFAAAYGAVLRSNNLQGLDKLSQFILETIFEQKEVYPNVLVRDYARNIIEYALYKKILNLAKPKIIRPPYHSKFPDSFPTNEEIDSYDYDYNSESFKDYYWGQNSILMSMRTERGRGGGYGDFGRYTFQSDLHGWSYKFEANDLSNYACKLIFEKYGYDVEKHGKFDRDANHGDRHTNTKERIGKKYQWLALYEVLARLSDNYQMSKNYWDDKEYCWYQGTFEPFVRNIDPTVICRKNKNQTNKNQETWWNKVEYNDWGDTYQNWLISSNDLPDPKVIIEIKDNQGNEWLVLESHLSWEESVPIGYEQHEHPHKHLWYQIRSYFVHNDEADNLIAWAKQKHFMGRWFPENHDEYQVFSREYYWSPAYRFFDDPYYGRSQWEEVYEKHEKKDIADLKSAIKSEIKDYSLKLFDELTAIIEVDEQEFSDNKLSSIINTYPPELLQKLEELVMKGLFPEDELIGKVMVTTESHNWESGIGDEEKPSYLAPRELMYEKMQLQYSKNIGEWLNAQGEAVCFDPSANQNTSSCLLIRKDILLKFLEENNLKIFWTCLGKKQIGGFLTYSNYFDRNQISEWLELSGVFTLLSNKVEGSLTTFPQSNEKLIGDT